jgi:hypothetical protein
MKIGFSIKACFGYSNAATVLLSRWRAFSTKLLKGSVLTELSANYSSKMTP